LELFDDVRREDANGEVILAKDEAHDVNAATQGGDAAGRQRQMQEPILQTRSHAWVRACTHLCCLLFDLFCIILSFLLYYFCEGASA
jgi:hypothetical protein